MVARMLWWRPWPPLLMTKKFQVRLVVRRMESVAGVEGEEAVQRVTAEVRWKGPKAALSSLWRTVKRNCTGEEEVRDGTVEWNVEFESVCTLTAHKENSFHPWEIAFAVFNLPTTLDHDMLLENSLALCCCLKMLEKLDVNHESHHMINSVLMHMTDLRRH